MGVIRDGIIQAIREFDRGASDIVVPDNIESLVAGRPAEISISWKSSGVLHFGDFLCWLRQNAGEERALLTALRDTDIPVPVPIAVARIEHGEVVISRSPGVDTMAGEIQQTDMRWEISSIAFAFARFLARLHSLDWTIVVPWMADTEALPEDIVDEQVEAAMRLRESTVERLDSDWKSFAADVLDWLELRRPVEVSVCLCHGTYRPENVYIEGEDVQAVVDWSNAIVTDASYDLAMLPVWLSDVGLAADDADLFAQAAHGAYLQSSPRGMGNLQYYAVARPFDDLLRLLTAAQPPDTDELNSTRATIERAMALGGRVPWKSR